MVEVRRCRGKRQNQMMAGATTEEAIGAAADLLGALAREVSAASIRSERTRTNGSSSKTSSSWYAKTLTNAVSRQPFSKTT